MFRGSESCRQFSTTELGAGEDLFHSSHHYHVHDNDGYCETAPLRKFLAVRVSCIKANILHVAFNHI